MFLSLMHNFVRIQSQDSLSRIRDIVHTPVPALKPAEVWPEIASADIGPSGLPPGVILQPRGHLAMTGGMYVGCHNGGAGTLTPSG